VLLVVNLFLQRYNSILYLFLNQVVTARPSDKDAKAKYSECNKIVRKIAFEKAIAVDENKKSVAESIDFDSIGKSEK
jgi:hypothetical protein